MNVHSLPFDYQGEGAEGFGAVVANAMTKSLRQPLLIIFHPFDYGDDTSSLASSRLFIVLITYSCRFWLATFKPLLGFVYDWVQISGYSVKRLLVVKDWHCPLQDLRAGSPNLKTREKLPPKIPTLSF